MTTQKQGERSSTGGFTKELELLSLRESNKELLEALEGMTKYIEKLAFSRTQHQKVEYFKAREAIAKAEGRE